ncbi:probable G-protein coupled receptor 82 [Aquarana catesbeiana]|uniref:probable G-protein coupled receptor 82 n=1 Tax=Aquarana catesbeiana TaxID=8400 RepID=UPI003CC9A2B8
MCNDTNITFSAMSTTGLPVLYGLMFLPSATGNLISLWIFSRLGRRSSTHIYLINLAISNMVVTTGMPFQIYFYAYALYMPYKSIECSIVLQTTNILTHCSMCVSITIFCWIAISRYATLVRYKERAQDISSSTYEKIIFGQILKAFRNPKIAGYLCVCVWIAFLFPTFTLFLFKNNSELDNCCSFEAEFGQEKSQISSVTQSTCFFFFFFIVLLFYGFFIKHIKKLQTNSCIDEKHLVHQRVKKNIAVIMVLLLVTFAPYHLIKFFLVGQYYSWECQELRVLTEIKNCCLCLAEFRSCTDPIVYFCLDESFQKTIQRFLQRNATGQKEDSNMNRLTNTQTPTVTGRVMATTANESCG